MAVWHFSAKPAESEGGMGTRGGCVAAAGEGTVVADFRIGDGV